MELNLTQKHLVKLLFLRGEESRKALALSLGLSNPGLTLSVKSMLEEGVLLLGNKIQTGKAGRNQEPLRLNPNYGYFIGVDIRKHYCYVCLTDFAGALLSEERYETVLALEKALEELTKSYKVLEIVFTVRNFKNIPSFLKVRQDLYALKARLEEKGNNVTFINNVESLAAIYHLYHPQEENFLLVKYGPGLGSAIYVHGEAIRRRNGMTSEIGHAYLQDGRMLENLVSFDALFDHEVEEEEGAKLLLGDPEKLQEVVDYLAITFLDADQLLALDKIVFTGHLLTLEEVRRKVVEKMKSIDPKFDGEKVVPFENYEELNRKKGGLQGFILRYDK